MSLTGDCSIYDRYGNFLLIYELVFLLLCWGIYDIWNDAISCLLGFKNVFVIGVVADVGVRADIVAGVGAGVAGIVAGVGAGCRIAC